MLYQEFFQACRNSFSTGHSLFLLERSRHPEQHHWARNDRKDMTHLQRGKNWKGILEHICPISQKTVFIHNNTISCSYSTFVSKVIHSANHIYGTILVVPKTGSSVVKVMDSGAGVLPRGLFQSWLCTLALYLPVLQPGTHRLPCVSASL